MLCQLSHRLFIVYADGAVQQVRHLRMDPPSGHVAVLGHADVAVAEMVGADAGRQSFVVDQGCDGLAEAVGGHLGRTQFLSCRAPLLAEVVRVAKRPGRRGEGDDLLAEVTFGLALGPQRLHIAHWVGAQRTGHHRELQRAAQDRLRLCGARNSSPCAGSTSTRTRACSPSPARSSACLSLIPIGFCCAANKFRNPSMAMALCTPVCESGGSTNMVCYRRRCAPGGFSIRRYDMLTIAKLSRWSINYYDDTARPRVRPPSMPSAPVAGWGSTTPSTTPAFLSLA